MAGFTIERQFTQNADDIRQTARRLADRLCSEHPVTAHWQDEQVCILSGMGVDGRVIIGDNTLTIEVKLGLLTRMFEDRMKKEINSYLDKHLN